MKTVLPLNVCAVQLVAILFLFVCYTCAEVNDLRIIGGAPATQNATKHQVSVRDKSVDTRSFGSGHRCGGCLINYNTVLTAAHCMVDSQDRAYPSSYYRVVSGNLIRTQNTDSTLVFDVQRAVLHSRYNPSNFVNDIGMLILKSAVPINHPTVQPIAIARTVPSAGTSCQVTGWGTTVFGGTSSSVLNAVNVSMISTATCNGNNSYRGAIKSGMLCAGFMEGGKDACQGDSGGPLVCNGILVGVVSHGRDCALPQYPGVYSDVAYYNDWIAKNDAQHMHTVWKLLTLLSVTLTLVGI